MVRGIWLVGPPGTGKTHRVRNCYPMAFVKSQSKWWDGYEGQTVVVLDDLDSDCLGHYLKIWADKWSCNGEIKGGTIPLLHKYFVVTSNFQVEELFKEATMQDAIRRRFTVHYIASK